MWAGTKFGAINIPRIGDEVIVDFLEGDPDRPIITGRVYNADHMPPYTLPDNKTQTGIKTRSTKGGNPDNFNELRFEDKKGKEELHIQAERDMSTYVKRNQSTRVDGDRSVSVGGNQSTTVTKNETQTYQAERSMTVAKTNKDEITGAHTGIYHAGRTETVEKGDTLTVKDSNKTVDVIGAYDITVKDHLKVTKASTSMTIDDNFVVDASGKVDMHNPGTSVVGEGTTLTLNGNSAVTITCGASSISMKSDGTIEITGKTVKIGNATNNAAFDPQGTTINGVKITSAAVGIQEISGALIKVG
jgi:type VI secretion system secreted protein VgrG